jgi:AGZA family xanthine/uracil permease-like MFS transporter
MPDPVAATDAKAKASDYRWLGMGDVDGFFGLMFDNMANHSFESGKLIIGLNLPAEKK